MKNGDTDTISDALKMFGDQDSAAKWFGHLNTKSDGSSIISDGIMEMFIKAFDTIDADAVKKNIAKGAKAESSSLGDILSDGIGNLVGGVTSFGSGISAVLGSVAQFAIPLILGGLAIHAGKSLWNNVLTNNNANKKYEESSQKYDNAVSERDSLQHCLRAYDNNISSASATLFIPDTTSNFLGRKQYFIQIWILLNIQHTAHFF